MENSAQPTAREHLDEVMRGYQSSTVLLAAGKVGIFAALGRDSRTASELASELSLDLRAVETVLLALTADGFLTLADDRFQITTAYAPYLLPDSPETLASILNHNHTCMLRWSALAEVMRTGQPAPRDTPQLQEPELRDFICGMENLSRTSSAEVAEKLDLSPFRKLLDLGGGPGTSSIVFARRYPALSCVVYDLPGPIAIAQEQITAAGLAPRVTTRSGDFLTDDLGEGYDLVYIANIIHSLGPDTVRFLLQKVHRAMAPHGTVMVKDMYLEDSRIRPRFAALFSVNMLTGTEAGKSYTMTETQRILGQCGFGDFESVAIASHSSVLVGRKA
jgi:hypothetical protein